MTDVIEELVDTAREVLHGNLTGLRQHTVQPGDNLSSISRKYYGCSDTRYALAIYQANTDKISDPNIVYPGQVLIIPHVSVKAAWHG